MSFREQCLMRGCDALFSVDGEVHLDNPDALKLLITHNRLVYFRLLVCDV